MMDLLKDILAAKIETWMAEIEASPDKKTIIDIAVVFEELLTSNILTVNFGEDLSNTPVEMYMREYKTGADFTLVRKTVKLGVGLKEIADQLCLEAGFKWMNPFYQTARSLTG
jgi:hypothetical protein